MERVKQECKLCDNIIHDENFKLIEDVIKDILDILLLKLTLNETQNVVCMTCYSKLLEAFKFKSTCLYTNNSIITCVDLENPKPVDLKEINGKEQASNILEDREVCRLCLQPMGSDYKSLREVPIDSIQIFIPEIIFAVTTNSIICIKCHDALNVLGTFIKRCVNVEETRNMDPLDMEGILLCNPSIKTEEIEIKYEETDDETLFETLWNLKKETNEEGNTSFSFQNYSKDTEETQSLDYLDDLTQASAQSAVASCKARQTTCKTTSQSLSANRQLRHKRVSEAQVNKSHKSRVKFTKKCVKVPKCKPDKSVFKCDECEYKTTQKANLLRHQLRHKDPSEVHMYECGECDYKSNQKDNLKKHQLIHKDPSEVQMYECDKCKFATKRKSSLIEHCLRHKDLPEKQMFTFDKCDYKSTRKSTFKQHKLIHKDPAQAQVYECDKCGFITKRKSGLVKHCLRHVQKQMLTCDKCDYKSIRKSHFKRHQLMHKDPSEVPIYECGECDYKSIRIDNLKSHQLRHRDLSEVRMYECDKCKFITKRRSTLIQHCLRHKNISEEQMFACDKCDYKSIRRSHLNLHQLTHDDQSKVQIYKCDKCDYKSIRKHNLKNHQLTHKDPSEVQMYGCDKCKYKTKRKWSCIRHILRHKDLPEKQMFTFDKLDYKNMQTSHQEWHQWTNIDPSEVQIYKCDE